ncbi:MAG: nucleotidyltransferase family protein [Desulfobulbus oligotrophicus]|jgi:CTP:molybdopterin cytidylyltransferase MocA|nr:nucleotidyltransferase family protein [Desulfobulbus oligotrophicus]
MAPRLSGLILAAGFSSRMQALKPLLPLGETSVLGQCIDTLRKSGIQDIMVVAGHRGSEVAVEAVAHGARAVLNADFADGMFSSIRCGAQQLGEAEYVALLPVDIPLIRSGTLYLMQQALQGRTGVQVVHPEFNDQRGHPLLIATALLRDLVRAASAPGGLRPLLERHERMQPEQVVSVKVPDANILFDMDTPESYAACCERFPRRDYPTLEEGAVILEHIYPMPPKGVAHGHLVGELAAGFAEAINVYRDAGLCVDLCRVAGWLHDVAKGQEHHEETGGRWLDGLGFSRAACIVAAHKDLDWHPGDPLTERELVHLADKLAKGGRLVTLDQRFGEKSALYKDDPDAQEAVQSRYLLAQELALALEEASGQTFVALCAHLASRCSR